MAGCCAVERLRANVHVPDLQGPSPFGFAVDFGCVGQIDITVVAEQRVAVVDWRREPAATIVFG